jgi:pimeloyl-ACP methyl ester carboxylesterase
MRLPRRVLAFVALAVLGACGTDAQVHTSRADPIGEAPVSTDAPGDTTGPTDSTPATSPETPSNDTLHWVACDDPNAHDPRLECATLQVPLDYDNPSGDTIDLALIKYPASEDRVGAVLLNPGGPGASGFDPIAFSGAAIAQGLGIGTLDLIGFDPRGVDRSGGLRCETDEYLDQHMYVDETPDTPEEQTLKEEADTGLATACKEKYGDTLRFYSTVNTARDMDAIRDALGDDQISYIGFSYGTYLGATYATMFPDRVRGMVLDSVVEPIGDTVQQAFETQLVGFEGALDNWIAWCQDNADCAFQTADVGARWDALRQQLDDTPITGDDGRVANSTTMFRATQAALYSESEWPVLGEALAKAEDGDPSGMFVIADSFNGRNDDGTYNTLLQSFPVILCASGIANPLPPDPDGLLATLHAAAPRFTKAITAPDLSVEGHRCAEMVGDVQPAPVSYDGDGPIVLVGGANDPATPIRWAQKMVGELGPNARLVTFTGEGHAQLLTSTCITEIEGELLADLTLPDPDTVCEPDSIVAKPDWWDDLPVPDGISGVASLPALLAATGSSPTQFFSEMRTTSLSADDAIAAYTDALSDAGFQQFDAPPVLPVDTIKQGAFSDLGDKILVVLAFPPEAFDDEGLQSAKADVPPDTTVIWLITIGA